MVTYFSESVIKDIPIPAQFTFPFYYTPHPLAVLAAEELQQFIMAQSSLDHNFGLEQEKDGLIIGKMFGVLVVKDHEGRLGYIAAFSGKLSGENHHPKFVPPVFDMLAENSFFLKEEENINAINAKIEALESDANFISLQLQFKTKQENYAIALQSMKSLLKENKLKREAIRSAQKAKLSTEAFEQLHQNLINESLYDKRQLRYLNEEWKSKLDELSHSIAQIQETIDQLKLERKQRSNQLQEQLFQQYQFLNSRGETQSLLEIFKKTPLGAPPAAAGECALPKLLQYAYLHQLHPIAMAEFWWGASPKSEIRKHQQFYPSCTGKCKPILGHMLEGIEVEENLLLQTSKEFGKLEILFEDDLLIVVNKPAGLRSVPGVTIDDSVYTRLKLLLGVEELYMIHRLDMDTSGILLIAKTTAAHKYIQKQFLNRTVKKRYVAILSKEIAGEEGIIDLPLSPDLLNRPRQIVCFETGKPSITEWNVVERKNGYTKIHFWPLTGRTHQLRVHAAHPDGLNASIVGDDVYGTKAERMYLHAAEISFQHPRNKEMMRFVVADEFDTLKI